MRDAYGGSSQGVARMFDELTNQEDGEEGPKGERRTSPTPRKDSETKWDENEDMNLFFDGP
jgi:histone demethylase JARID1